MENEQSVNLTLANRLLIMDHKNMYGSRFIDDQLHLYQDVKDGTRMVRRWFRPHYIKMHGHNTMVYEIYREQWLNV